MNAARTRDILAEERSRGIGADAQRGLYAVSRFAAAYSSILDAVSSASGPYAEIGWQTMSILLIVSAAYIYMLFICMGLCESRSW